MFIGLSNVTGTQYLLPTKRQKEYTISVICGAVINFIINACLIGRYGAIGASIGTVIAELAVTLVQMYFVRNDFDFKKIVRLTKNYFVSSMIMFLACLIIRKTIDNNFVSMVVQVIAGGTIYIICLLILKDKFIYEAINRIKNKVKGNLYGSN